MRIKAAFGGVSSYFLGRAQVWFFLASWWGKHHEKQNYVLIFVAENARATSHDINDVHTTPKYIPGSTIQYGQQSYPREVGIEPTYLVCW